MRIYVDGIGILGPGLAGWKSSIPALACQQRYTATIPPVPEVTMLPPNELRRSSQIVRWALTAAEEALNDAQMKASEVATVFASSCGETQIWHQLCTAMAAPERTASPTLFHHSVHNAAAGYWSIGAGSTQASTSLACHDASFSGGLLEAALQVLVEKQPVLLVAYDLPPPRPIYAARPLVAGFSVAIVVTERPSTTAKAELTLTLVDRADGEETRMEDPHLEMLRTGNPAARALPVAAAIAKQQRARLRLAYVDHLDLMIDVTPCPSC
jgi:Beta-ketoacyl synthase, N-terminal domain